MTTTDEEALLRAILADPGDDTVRLAYADHLDENPDVPCPSCAAILSPDRGGCWPCRECGAREWAERGTVRDPSRAARAEFIRVQVGLARLPDYWTADTADEVHRLRRRERELWQQYAPVWFSFPGYNAAAVWDNEPHIRWCRAGDPNEENVIGAEATRGFVSHVTTTAAVFLGGECRSRGPHHGDTCYGGRVQAANAQFTIECHTCNGTGRTEGIARAVFAAHPVTSVTLSDLSPTGPIAHGLQIGYWFFPRRDVPASLWEHLEFDRKGVAAVFAVYPTRAAALAALSAACCTYGRALAGLTPNP